MLLPMYIEIRCCRNDAKLFYKNQPLMPTSTDTSFAESYRLPPDIQMELGRLRRRHTDRLHNDLMFHVVFLIAFSVASLIAVIAKLAMYYHEKKKNSNRLQSQICLGENNKDCLSYAEADLILERVCNAITSDDFTYKAMKTNFDDAVLHETLKFNGNSRNSSQYHENRLIL